MRERGFDFYLPATHYFSQEKDCININERGAYGRRLEIWTKNRAKIVDENGREHEVIWVEKEKFSHDNGKILDFMKKELTERGIL